MKIVFLIRKILRGGRRRGCSSTPEGKNPSVTIGIWG